MAQPKSIPRSDIYTLTEIYQPVKLYEYMTFLKSNINYFLENLRKIKIHQIV